jgi:hypothetical protein
VGRSVPTQAASIAHVELRLAGTFGVVRDGRQLADREIGSRKSRTLLKLLAVERPALVPVDRIEQVLAVALDLPLPQRIRPAPPLRKPDAPVVAPTRRRRPARP